VAARVVEALARLPEATPAWTPPSPRSTEPAGALSRAAARLRTTHSVDELRDVVAAVIPAIFARAERFELFLAGADGLLEPALHTIGESWQQSRQLLAGVRARLRHVLDPLAEPRLLAAAETAGRRAIITAPIVLVTGEQQGALIVEASPAVDAFTAMELVALEGIAALASAALQRLGAVDGARRARAENDRTAARQLQRGFMSSRLPPGIGITAHAEYLPAFDVGGDFYCVKHVADRTISVAIGDVSGNGVSAALLMSRVQADMERSIGAGDAPAAVLGAANQRLTDVAKEMFVTAACIRVDADARRLQVANAGHLPIVLRRATGEVIVFGGASGVPLGVAACEYEEEEFFLERGDILLLMTDGLLEALDHPSGHRGLELLVDEVRGSPHDVQVVNERIRAAVDRARRAHPLDDVTWVALQLAC
jgi:serine phosphatase RsbU (regulator of sigma subunit)